MSIRYRYEDSVFEDGVKLSLLEFIEIKKTPKGAWVLPTHDGKNPMTFERKRFVLDGYGKRYCHQTKEMAWESYGIRKKWQFRHAELSLAKAEFALKKIGALVAAPDDTVNLGKPEYFEWYNFD